VNQFDVTASLLQDFFTDKPDFTPYTLERHDERIFDAEKAMKKYNKTIDWRKIEQGPELDNEEVERKMLYRNQYDNDDVQRKTLYKNK
jgi:DNA repair ATPase RecN